MMKKEYTKPTAKVMELNFSDVICASTYTRDVCFRIASEGSGSTVNVDPHADNSITWNEWTKAGE